jgi:peptidoglycan/xylan/chitin deacetylase (PgdA/CDA1 family)
MYHPTARKNFVDRRVDDWKVLPEQFERHMRELRDHAEPVSIDELAERLHDRRLSAVADARRPLVCVTLDDGYASACEQALPVLARYGIPATFFVPTAYVGGCGPMPFDQWGHLNRGRVAPETWRAASWADLEAAVQTGLVTIGSHSHAHLEGSACRPERLAEETGRSRALLLARLGPAHARVYAYPYGCSRLGDVPPAYEEAVRGAGYELAVTTDLGLACCSENLFRLPRVEVHQLDSSWVLRAKVHGALAPYRLTDRLRSPVH